MGGASLLLSFLSCCSLSPVSGRRLTPHISDTMRSIAALSLAAFAQAASFSTETIHGDSAPILSTVDADHIPDSYIIKFKDHVDDTAATGHHSWIQSIHEGTDGDDQYLELRKRGVDDVVGKVFGGLKHTFAIGDGFKGYAGHFHPDVIEQVRNHPDVEYIERDTMVHTMLPIEVEDSVSEDKCDGDTQKQAPWGLARVSHRDTLGFGTFNKYLYTEEGGEGVDAYVIDTGTNTEHVDFEGRAHGGKKHGVAKKANIYAVKVLRSNGSGSMADVVKGVEFAAESHQSQVEAVKNGKRKGFKGSVANMSLGGGKTSALDAAVNAAVKAGVHFAVAAGNDNADACKYSPAAAELPLTVGASDLNDDRAYFSNYGKCTDIFGPGVSIQSTWIGSPYAINTISGTSMASPHLAGLLAYYLSLQPAGDSEYAVAEITPKELKQSLISVATEGVLSGMPDSATPNLLAWNGGGCSNFSKIMEAGGYKVERAPSTMEKVGAVIEDDLEIVQEQIAETFHHFEHFEEKAAKLSAFRVPWN